MDKDVVNFIHYLRWKVEADLGMTHEFLFCSEDTPEDAKPYLNRTGTKLPKSLRSFVLAVDTQLRGVPQDDFMFGFPLSDRPRKAGQPRTSFVAMPYGPSWYESVKETIVQSAGNRGFSCIISDDLAKPGSIITQVWEGIRRSEALIADLTGVNPNVYYELGLAHALGKPTVILTQDQGELPFDVRPLRRINYSPRDHETLAQELEKAFAQIPPRYKFDEETPASC